MNNDDKKVALLIDADNAQSSKIEAIIKDASTYGRIVIKRAYGNWSKKALAPWEKEIKRFAISAIQQFDFASGKNSSDMAMTIDAMELLHTGIYDYFVLVSSDSDFTSLAIHIHESGVYVVGYGKQGTTESFRNACDEFVYVESLSEVEEGADLAEAQEAQGTGGTVETPQPEKKNGKAKKSAPQKAGQKQIKALNELLRIAEEKYADDTGYVNVSSAGAYIKRVRSDFNIKVFGYTKLTDFLKAYPNRYDIQERSGKGTGKLIVYKCK